MEYAFERNQDYRFVNGEPDQFNLEVLFLTLEDLVSHRDDLQVRLPREVSGVNTWRTVQCDESGMQTYRYIREFRDENNAATGYSICRTTYNAGNIVEPPVMLHSQGFTVTKDPNLGVILSQHARYVNNELLTNASNAQQGVTAYELDLLCDEIELIDKLLKAQEQHKDILGLV